MVLDDTTAEVVRQLQGMGLILQGFFDSTPDNPGVLLLVRIPELESVASGNDRKHN